LLDEDYLILSTIHSAKGQEWKSVFVLNVVDGCMPSRLRAGTSAEIEEERRLLYVAMTRAKDDLHVPQRFFTHGQKCAKRSPCVCITDALHSGSIARSVRKDNLAPADGRNCGTFGEFGRSVFQLTIPHIQTDHYHQPRRRPAVHLQISK
jgi:hypothetical protein